MEVTIRKQGGLQTQGIAVARMGTQLLVQYRIDSGEERERWFTQKRVEGGTDAERDQLPRYKRQTCKAVAFETPVIATEVRDGEYSFHYDYDTNQTCSCGADLLLDTGNLDTDNGKRVEYNDPDYSLEDRKRLAVAAFGTKSHSEIVKVS